MNSSQLIRWLRKQGCEIKDKPGSGHVVAVLGDRITDVPVHGGSKQIPAGTVRAIMRALGIEGRMPR
jgi:mRNA interferase HicA